MDAELHPLDYHDTPLTNAFLRRQHVAADAMWAEFAAKMERENAQLREQVAALEKWKADRIESEQAHMDY